MLALLLAQPVVVFAILALLILSAQLVSQDILYLIAYHVKLGISTMQEYVLNAVSIF